MEKKKDEYKRLYQEACKKKKEIKKDYTEKQKKSSTLAL
jgi:hypothetical protein